MTDQVHNLARASRLAERKIFTELLATLVERDDLKEQLKCLIQNLRERDETETQALRKAAEQCSNSA